VLLERAWDRPAEQAQLSQKGSGRRKESLFCWKKKEAIVHEKKKKPGQQFTDGKGGILQIAGKKKKKTNS